jgi:hypothetical protein
LQVRKIGHAIPLSVAVWSADEQTRIGLEDAQPAYPFRRQHPHGAKAWSQLRPSLTVRKTAIAGPPRNSESIPTMLAIPNNTLSFVTIAVGPNFCCLAISSKLATIFLASSLVRLVEAVEASTKHTFRAFREPPAPSNGGAAERAP